jgi:uncharacterized membrane protein YdjX (TVP38/TMEM64 family)
MTAPARRGLRWLRIGLVGVAGLALIVLGRDLASVLPTIPERIHALGPAGPLAFVALYAVATVAFVPGALLTLAAGGLFGVWLGVAVVLAGATIGASLAFLIARYVARKPVEQLLAGNAKFAAIDRAVGRDGRKITFLLRLSPAFPFNLLNYGLGLTQVRFADFLVASIGMLPGTLLYVYSGSLVGTVAGAAAGTGPARGPGYYVVLGLGLVATLVVTVLITRIARRALAGAMT